MANKVKSAANAADKKTTTNVRATIDSMVRKAIRALALVLLSYLAWKGVADLVSTAHVARLFVAYISVAGLLALYILV